MDYHVFTEVHLSLETYHNAGLTPDMTKQVIESFPWGVNYCQPSGINHNWKFKTGLTDPESIERLVDRIELALQVALFKLNGKRISLFGDWVEEDYEKNKLKNI